MANDAFTPLAHPIRREIVERLSGGPPPSARRARASASPSRPSPATEAARGGRGGHPGDRRARFGRVDRESTHALGAPLRRGRRISRGAEIFGRSGEWGGGHLPRSHV